MRSDPHDPTFAGGTDAPAYICPIPAVGVRVDRSFMICRTDIIRHPAEHRTMNEERTLLSFSVIVRPEFVDLVWGVSTPGPEGVNHWIDAALRIPQWGWLQDWAAYPGSNYIPFEFSLEFEHCHTHFSSNANGPWVVRPKTIMARSSI